ncbi:MAG: hypothetical protein IPJ61_09795 [Tessaracoccus sp.]|uniref:hypothetical protein n=1 Tax=Tessaracoccus sp. TaxID=1971211 RepID=UPI001ECC47BD|nr:hypothetical protein [Tessaracoccus sp.]MBK7821353.1 hypothetical protein [Tessaracoccus sp.]
MASIVVLGSELRAGLITAALSRAGYSARCLSPELAHRSPGHTADALAIMLWPPGIHPAVEAEHHAGGSGALHAWWDGSFAEVGPFVTPGVGPCPLCLGARGPLPQPGHDPALAAWVAATVTLTVHGLLTLGRTTLTGASLTWDTRRPGITAHVWQRRDDCAAAGCT